MKKFLIIGLLLTLTACAKEPPLLRSDRLVALNPPESLYECNLIKKLPEAKNLTDLQVAKLINRLYQDNAKCKLSMNSLRAYIKSAQQEINKE